MSAPVRLAHFVDNADFRADGEIFDTILNPANEEVLWAFPNASAQTVSFAVASARRAAGTWADIEPQERARYLHRCVDVLSAGSDTYAALITRENGKPIIEARGEVQATIDELRSIVGLALHIRTGKQMSGAGELSFQQGRPRGVVACIVPWNYPLLTVLTAVFSALVVGNTVVLKPSEKTPNSALLPIRDFAASLPVGALNVVLGDGRTTGAALVESEHVDFVLFVGSLPTGQAIARICADRMRPSIMELGGKDAFIIDEGGDLDRLVPMALACAFRNAGQICTSSERFIVHRSVYADFSNRLALAANAMRVGDGMDETTQMGPLIDARQRAIVARHLSDAVDRGARLLSGEHLLPTQGFFHSPAVVADVPEESTLWVEETFGPVAPIVPFEDFADALRIANASQYGLGAVLFTPRSDHAMQAAEQLQVGLLKINAPIGVGTGNTWEPARRSGFGFGGGRELLQSLIHQKSVVWRA
ncbi:aldehyde dehydrogenase [Agrobacterium tumefaciens]|uniref:aldehyde dehydrogenase family protein n=1 Tax=Agrobacterium tumefaciens complex TaxID=1183400 RepID=UPI0015742B4E|nr:aldehyde dehydrogenase family protein [Agrobacterium fabrum]NSZ09736.1 aldehyde dehydrogenase [Agrobacterium tumefaciens]